MFENSENIVITGGTFVQVVPSQGSEFQALYQHISIGALLDSGERFNPPRCHPETRKSLLSTILTWITKTDRNTLVLWLKGSAGSGKSALAQSIAERCRSLDLPVATFFFSRVSPERCHEKFLSPTISYQIALSKPETRQHIENTVRVDPSVFGLAFRSQFQKLIVDPLLMIRKDNANDEMNPPQLVILDALDECHDPKAQGYILDVITQKLERCENIPLLFVITSRPEDHICIKFASGILKRITLQISLEDYFGAHDDIRIFINSGFDEIKANHPLRHHLPSTWPPRDVIEELVQKSAGQFVYASIVVEYVSSRQHRPPERLDVIRGLSPHDGDSPFTELDALFKHVFTLIVHRKSALRILSAIFLMDLEMSPEVVEKLLSLKPGDVMLHLSGLASLVDYQDHRKKIKVLHPPLKDFLLDPTRSEDLYIDDKMAHADIATACLRQLEALGEQSDDWFKVRPYNPSCMRVEEPILIDYACYNIETHLDFACGTEALHDALLSFHLGRFHNSATNLLHRNDAQITLEDIWYFIPTFFDCIQNTVIFDDWEDIYDHHTEAFDWYVVQELDKYTGDSQLRDLVTMLTICHSPMIVRNLDNAPHLIDSVLQLDGSTEGNFVLVDEGSLNIRHMVRRHGQSEPYIELLCQFLEDPSRSGRHFIDGEKYAFSALRCSEQIAKPFPHSKEERDAHPFIWTLECTPPLLLHAAYHEELVAFLEGSYLETIPPHIEYSCYPTLVRMVKEARIAYLILSSFEAVRNIGTCSRHASQFQVLPQGLNMVLNSATRPQPAFDNLLLFPQSASKMFCCNWHILAEYFAPSRIAAINYTINSLRVRDQASVIIHVENPFPEIEAQPIEERLQDADLTPTLAGVIKILAYRIWRDLVQRSGQ